MCLLELPRLFKFTDTWLQAKRLPDGLREVNPQIDWRRLITFRDFLVHNYELIGLRYVWDAVKDLPQLHAAFESLLRSLEDGEEQTG